MDRAGFDVRNLEDFCKRLEAKGVTLTVPYRRRPEFGNLGTAVDHRSVGHGDRADGRAWRPLISCHGNVT